MKLSRFTILGLLICCHGNAYASINSLQQYISSHLVTSVAFGPTWGNGGDAQTLTLSPNVEKTYTTNRPTHTLLDGEFFAGIQQTLPPSFIGQLGFALVTTDNTYLSGNIWDDANPAFNNYAYQYQLSHTHLAMKGKLLLDKGYLFMPWVSLSLGVGFNRATNFTNSPDIFTAVTMPNFTSNTTTSFTYTVGIGAQKQLNQHWQVGAGYEFADWGRSQLNPANGQINNNTPSLSHYYTNGFLINATFIA